VYFRGAMTLHQLRLRVGDSDFFRILRTWAQSRAGDNVTTAEFIALAERISGQHLDGMFSTWLYTPGKPAVPAAARRGAAAPTPPVVRSILTIAKHESARRR
jgi:aminopeptidase N